MIVMVAPEKHQNTNNHDDIFFNKLSSGEITIKYEDTKWGHTKELEECIMELKLL